MNVSCIAHGGTNRIKVNALRFALDRVGMGNTHILAEDVTSSIDAQPIGLDMAARGAENRATLARENGGYRASFGIGIESGLTLVRGVWIDTATVALSKDGVLVGLSVSAGLAFPYDCVMDAIAAGVRYHTAGEFIAKKCGGDPHDPHSTLTGGRITRQALIADAIYVVIADAIHAALIRL